MAEAFKDADIVYPKSLGSFRRHGGTDQAGEEGKFDELKDLEKRCLVKQRKVQGLGMHEELMAPLNMAKPCTCIACRPTITGVSCKQGEWCRQRVRPIPGAPLTRRLPTSRTIIAAMIFLSKFRDRPRSSPSCSMQG
jgi:hypothetical protein